MLLQSSNKPAISCAREINQQVQSSCLQDGFEREFMQAAAFTS